MLALRSGLARCSEAETGLWLPPRSLAQRRVEPQDLPDRGRTRPLFLPSCFPQPLPMVRNGLIEGLRNAGRQEGPPAVEDLRVLA